MLADRVLHLTQCADDHKHRGNYTIKGAIRVNDHLWYSTQALKLSAPSESVALQGGEGSCVCCLQEVFVLLLCVIL